MAPIQTLSLAINTWDIVSDIIGWVKLAKKEKERALTNFKINTTKFSLTFLYGQ